MLETSSTDTENEQFLTDEDKWNDAKTRNHKKSKKATKTPPKDTLKAIKKEEETRMGYTEMINQICEVLKELLKEVRLIRKGQKNTWKI